MGAKPFVGTAGWSFDRRYAGHFPEAGSQLERYSRSLNAAEINSSFHRPHRRSTYERWPASVPEDLRFSVKLPKTITHERRLVGYESARCFSRRGRGSRPEARLPARAIAAEARLR
jgi:uncharacterized protein YecE (DUF72 family)